MSTFRVWRIAAAEEFAKGFAIWDFAPGHYILNAAGGTVLNLQGHALPLDYELSTLTDIAKAMNNDRDSSPQLI